MAVEITVQNSDEFQEMVDNKDFRIAEAVVDGILKNVKTNVLNTFNELNRNIEDVIIFRKSSEAKIILEKNRNTILYRYSVEKSLDQWNSLYK